MVQVSMWTRVQMHVADCSHMYLRHATMWPRLIITRVQRATCINPRGRFDMSINTRVINTRVHMSPRYILPRCH